MAGSPDCDNSLYHFTLIDELDLQVSALETDVKVVETPAS